MINSINNVNNVFNTNNNSINFCKPLLNTNFTDSNTNTILNCGSFNNFNQNNTNKICAVKLLDKKTEMKLIQENSNNNYKNITTNNIQINNNFNTNNINLNNIYNYNNVQFNNTNSINILNQFLNKNNYNQNILFNKNTYNGNQIKIYTIQDIINSKNANLNVIHNDNIKIINASDYNGIQIINSSTSDNQNNIWENGSFYDDKRKIGYYISEIKQHIEDHGLESAVSSYQIPFNQMLCIYYLLSVQNEDGNNITYRDILNNIIQTKSIIETSDDLSLDYETLYKIWLDSPVFDKKTEIFI